ncbi:hypothetical protein JCM17844_21190 [Iodidimonas gelatinilytica]|uniref:Isochorismatase-like domain-containing protein n=1 Tax=Iodidimonas gelatinilytica TaxID=1236966 RepID=A0A5A7MQZ7_9PROT|nr:isochorismatase family protein [Iodidimonas gelatinilytica]GEQ98482.1 hypothetical protein JCM17844_21190 [Iodidimonas gelatinilytica]
MAATRQPNHEQDYASAGFGNRLGMGHRPALLVVDIVKAYLDPASPLYANVEPAAKAAGNLVNAARKANIPVIFTNVRYTPGGADGGLFFRKVASLKVLEAGTLWENFPITRPPSAMNWW